MHWPANKEFERVDGAHAILILPAECGLDATAFKEEYLSELLRSSIVAIVSALDRYCHEVIAKSLVREFRSGNPHVGRLELSLNDIEAVLSKAEARKRPRNALRNALQTRLYRETFQSPTQIAEAMKLAGKKDIWNTCAQEMGISKDELTTRLNKLIARRNRIVHEGDLVRHQRAGAVRRHEIQTTEVAEEITWITQLVNALDNL